MDNSKRDFLRLTSIGLFGLHPTVSLLARIFKHDEGNIEKYFDDDYHFFANNLTNLHFYFINARFKGNELRKIARQREAFMVVKIPQQHISEELLSEPEFDAYYGNSSKRTVSEISGFSFLSFRLFPKMVKDLIKEDIAGKTYMNLSEMNNLLAWDNPSLFELLVPSKSDYKKFDSTWNGLITDDSENPDTDYIISLYSKICKEIFAKNYKVTPMTVLEIPQGMIVEPYVREGERANMQTNTIEKKQFLFNKDSKEVIRTVEEIWSAQMFFDTVKGKRSPTLRAAGYINRGGNATRDTAECPIEDAIFLPTMLDKKEIVYLTSLGRGNNEDVEWDIKTRGLSFTGLGAIAKFHYKNFTPPNGYDLAEYEHHITLGRDEYIKVARIGVISATGQKALHIKIGQRKIKNGTSYMDFKQYVEIIQKEIDYHHPADFIQNDPAKSDPIKYEAFNYIQARQNKTDSSTIHSYADCYGNEDLDFKGNVWTDSYLWSINKIEKVDGAEYSGKYLPKKWTTNYKRWPFKKIQSVTFITQPLDLKDPDAHAESENCTGYFWPVKEFKTKDTDNDCYLDFTGQDWNNNTVEFSSTFLFIRKTWIESIQHSKDKLYGLLNAEKKGFIYQKFERRHIRFVNQKIAFTPDFSIVDEGKENLPNKSNLAKTDYLEYYFSLCLEDESKLLAYSNGKITNTQDSLPIVGDSIFNLRVFPLFPQTLRAQVYVESLPDSLASIIEYNEDYVDFGFGHTKTIGKDANKKEVLYNKGKLIFNQTERFMANRENVLEQIDGKWHEIAEPGYLKIKQVFSGAGNAIGGLVNPDFDIQSIGLVKQSIAIGKEFNAKYEEVENFTDKIEKFNPSDLLRQAPEIFNGISLIDILQEIFPESEAPINEIRNVAGQIEALSQKIINSEFYQIVMAEMAQINETIKEYPQKVKGYQNLLASYQSKIGELKDIYNINYGISDFENLVKNKIDSYKIDFLEFNGLTVTINVDEKELAKRICDELCMNLETVYPYHQVVNNALKNLQKIRNYKEDGLTLTKEAVAVIDEFIKTISDYDFILVNIHATDSQNILFDRIIAEGKVLDGLVKPYYQTFKEYADFVSKELAARIKFQTAKLTLNEYQKFYNDLKASKVSLDQKIAEYKKKKLPEILVKLDALANESDRRILAQFNNEIVRTYNELAGIFNFLNRFGLPGIVDTYEKAVKDYNAIQDRFKCTAEELKKITGIIENENNLKKQINDITLKVRTFYRDHFDSYRTDIGKLTRQSQNIVNAYHYITGEFFWNGLDKNDPSQKIILDMINETNSINYQFKDMIIPIIEQNREINNAIKARIRDLKKESEEELKKLLDFSAKIKLIEQSILDRAKESGNIIGKIRAKIQHYQELIQNNPEIQKYQAIYAEGKELYNLLTSISQKEINYNWQTSSFKNADFGIVSFVASSNPKTTLDVNVKSVIYFQPNKFPSVISRIDAVAENRLKNFSISLLKAIIINFNEVSFVAATNQKPKFEVKVRDVQFAGAFSFVQALESMFKDLLGDNFKISIQPQNVTIQYLLIVPFIGAPSFGFKDILFRILYTLHFDSKPMELGVGIGSPENRTKLSVGIYTGLFYFLVIGNPKQGITVIEVSIEFGGYFGLSLGPLRGEVKLVVGLYYRKDPTGVIMEGYFLCEGNVKLWFVMITARFYMGVRSQGNYVEGRCTVSYEISLGRFFKRSFSATYYKKLAGASPQNGQSGNSSQIASSNPARYAAITTKALGIAQATESTNQSLTAIHPLQRNIKPLMFDEWKLFINSYKD